MTDIPITLTSKTTDFTTHFPNPIKLDPRKKYKVAFVSLETYNSIPNITNENNNFTYSNDNGKTWKCIKLRKNAYDIVEINDEVQRQMIIAGDYNVEQDSMYINISTFTLSSVIEISHPEYKINFDVENSIGPLLGFDKELLSYGYNQSPKIVIINQVNSILIHTNIINGSYDNGLRAKVIHSFSPAVGPGVKIRERPQPELIFCSINLSEIDNIRIWLTDEEKNPIDLQGEEITVRLLIREVENIKQEYKRAIKELKEEKLI